MPVPLWVPFCSATPCCTWLRGSINAPSPHHDPGSVDRLLVYLYKRAMCPGSFCIRNQTREAPSLLHSRTRGQTPSLKNQLFTFIQTLLHSYSTG
jgi:hypothetical protein